MAWVPVVGFWSTTNTISEQALGAALGGGSVKYKDVIVPTDDVAAIEDALGVTIAGSVKRGTPDEVKAAVKAGSLGLLRASDVTPGVRALGIGKQQLFGISRTDSLDTWPLRGEVEDPVAWDQARTWTLVAGGDILLDRGVALAVRNKKAGVDFPYDGGSASIVRETCCNATYGTKTPVTQRDSKGGAFRKYLEAADIALANLESPVDNQFVYHSQGHRLLRRSEAPRRRRGGRLRCRLGRQQPHPGRRQRRDHGDGQGPQGTRHRLDRRRQGLRQRPQAGHPRDARRDRRHLRLRRHRALVLDHRLGDRLAQVRSDDARRRHQEGTQERRRGHRLPALGHRVSGEADR